MGAKILTIFGQFLSKETKKNSFFKHFFFLRRIFTRKYYFYHFKPFNQDSKVPVFYIFVLPNEEF